MAQIISLLVALLILGDDNQSTTKVPKSGLTTLSPDGKSLPATPGSGRLKNSIPSAPGTALSAEPRSINSTSFSEVNPAAAQRDPTPWMGTSVGALLWLLVLAGVAHGQWLGWRRYHFRKRLIMIAFWAIIATTTALKVYFGSYAWRAQSWRQSLAWTGEDVILGVTLGVFLWFVLSFFVGVSPLREKPPTVPKERAKTG